MAYWRKIKSRCQQCHRPVTAIYEVREGPAPGGYCGRFCYEKAVAREKELKKDPLKKEEEKPEIGYW